MFKKIIFITSLTLLNTFSCYAVSSFYFGPAANFLNISSGSYKGVAPALYLGYGSWMSDYFYWALEGYAAFEPYNSHSNDNNLLKTRYNYGLGLIPAVDLDDTLILYGRLGVVRTSFKNLDIAKNGYQLGLGLEAPVNPCWSMRLEYSYSLYKEIDYFGNVHINQLMFGIIYRFEPILGPIS